LAETKKIADVDFFTGIFAALAMEGFQRLLYNKAFDEDVEKIFQEFADYAKQNGFEMRFCIKLHPFHRDSIVARTNVLSAVQRGVIHFDGTRPYSTIKIDLTREQAKKILEDAPWGKLFLVFSLKIVDIMSPES